MRGGVSKIAFFHPEFHNEKISRLSLGANITSFEQSGFHSRGIDIEEG